MAEAPPKIPGNPEASQDVLGKLDQLLHRHRPTIAGADPAQVPVLTDALAEPDVATRDGIPTLTDVVGDAGATPAPASPGVSLSTLEGRLVAAFVATLERERERLRGSAVERGQPQVLDVLILALTRAAPALVRNALAEALPPDATRPERGPP